MMDNDHDDGYENQDKKSYGTDNERTADKYKDHVAGVDLSKDDKFKDGMNRKERKC